MKDGLFTCVSCKNKLKKGIRIPTPDRIYKQAKRKTKPKVIKRAEVKLDNGIIPELRQAKAAGFNLETINKAYGLSLTQTDMDKL